MLQRLMLLMVLAAPLAAQDLPPLPPGVTPEQARLILQERPELGARVREWIRSSGLPPNEIRARLRSAGYPAEILDAYMMDIPPDSLGAMADTTFRYPFPSVRVLNALRVAGIQGPTRGDSLLVVGDSIAYRLFADSVRFALLSRDEALARDRRRIGALGLFGQDVFRTPTTALQVVVSGPVGDGYVLGPGDALAVILTGATETAFTTEVTGDGLVVLPQAGRTHVANLTLADARRVIFERLRTVYATLGREPGARTRLDVSVVRVRMNSIRVVGEAGRPGTYQLAATGGVLAALYEAAGPTARGNWRAIEIRRNGQLVGSVDLYEYLMTGTLTQDVPLASGDVVFVPPAGPRVKVAGAVRRPAIYELRPGEGVREAIRYAGGPEADAAVEAATLARVLAPGDRPERGFLRTVETVPLGAVLAGTAPPVLMADGDSLTVFLAAGGQRLGVTVAGSVWQPGTYQLTQGMRLWDALQAAGGLRPETYRGRVQVLRTMPDSTRRMFGVALPADGAGPPSENPPLMERDSVVVYARTAFRPRRWVAVGGAVQRPDTFAFAEAMTLRDAVLLAGGVTDGADLTEAIVSRVGITGITTHRVPLDSTYVFDATAYLARPAGANAPDFTLTPGDAVTIRTVPGWVPPQRVVVTGAVADPGTYLVDATERLSSVLDRAGGVTPQALPGGIALYRSAPEGGQRRVGVDLERDLVLLAGDSIHIPAMNATVRIEGAVNQPTVVAHQSGAGIDHYVSAGGGWAQNAHRNETYVIQANGIVERGGTPGPGSTVVVPELDLELVQPSIWGAALPAIISGVASILATIATIIVFSNR